MVDAAAWIDLRSDTVTRPDEAMRRAIAEAVVDDDVIDVDPTVDRLQRRTAELLGKEAALFMPSGTMTNQVAVRLHCRPGDEFICDRGCHIYNYEQGAFAQLSGLVAQTVDGEAGIIRLEQLEGLIRPANEHLVRTRLVTLENTHNRGGGRILPFEEVSRICAWAHERGLATHLDGARLMNAVVASGITAARWSAGFDTVSLCFSKGLGAPVGSVLAGTAEMMARARYHRKLFGGGMRQAGVLAAAALHALDHHVEGLAVDHQNAQEIAAAVRESQGLSLCPEQVDTNIVIFRVAPELATAADFVAGLKQKRVRVLSMGPEIIRVVTHRDVSPAACREAADAIGQLALEFQRGEVTITEREPGY